METTVCTVNFGRQLTDSEKLIFGGHISGVHATCDVTFEDVAKYTYKVLHDRDHSGPRVEYDNLSVMHCAHKRYTLGDKDARTPFVDDDTHARDLRDDVLAYLPIYMYDHGGFTLSHSPFDCSWDSGLLGWQYVTKTAARENWPDLEGELLESACLRMMEAELEEYDQFVQGNVYGYVIENLDGGTEDSCWGFIGDDIDANGMIDNADEQHHAGLRKAWEDRHD